MKNVDEDSDAARQKRLEKEVKSGKIEVAASKKDREAAGQFGDL